MVARPEYKDYVYTDGKKPAASSNFGSCDDSCASTSMRIPRACSTLPPSGSSRPTIIRSPADAQALAADRWGYMRQQQLSNAPGVEPSLDEMLRDYMRTQQPVAPDDAIIAPVGEVTAAPLAPVSSGQ